MILDAYPYTLQYKTVSSSGTEDDNGDFHPGTDEFVGNIKCNAVPSGQSNEKLFEDGVARTYSYIIEARVDCKDFSIDDSVKLILLDKTERVYKVKGFHRYQHSCKIWV